MTDSSHPLSQPTLEPIKTQKVSNSWANKGDSQCVCVCVEHFGIGETANRGLFSW